MVQNGRLNGTIKKLVKDKNFGFIRYSDGSGREIFFHRSSLGAGVRFEDLREGQEVTFEEGRPGDKGPRADDVRPD